VWAILWLTVVLIVVLITPRSYTVRASFVPQARRGSSSITELAAQVGLLPGADAGQSPAFYVSLLGSHELQDAVVRTQYDMGGERRTLVDIYRISEGPEPARVERAIRRLRTRIEFSPDTKTGIVTIVVRSPDPLLSRQISARFLQLLNEFNLSTRQSQAAAERKFTESRLAEVTRDLREAEDRLQSFLQQNRDYRSSPVLELAQQRLMQQVTVQRSLYSSLNVAFEQAKIEEVRDTPVISVVEHPAPPALPDSRALVVKCLLALFFGAGFGLLLALAGDLLHGREGDVPEEVTELRALWEEARSGVTQRLRSLGGSAG